MTDNEIIKALECLTGAEVFCRDCAFVKYDHGFACKKNVSKAAIALINRQKAEIERLRKLLDDKCNRCIAKDRADAIKEFAERLKSEKFTHRNFGELVYVEDIGNLAKEMTEEL